MVSTDVEARELARLKKLMQNPSYWRDRDTAIVKAVSEGFENLYDQQDKSSNIEAMPNARQGQLANILGLNGQKNKDDTYIAHLTPGEIIVPLSAQTEEVMALLSQTLGEDLPTYTVGSGKEQINPESGLPAFAGKWGPVIYKTSEGSTYEIKVKHSLKVQEISNTVFHILQLNYSMEWFKLDKDGNVRPNIGLGKDNIPPKFLRPNTTNNVTYSAPSPNEYGWMVRVRHKRPPAQAGNGEAFLSLSPR